MATYKSDEVTLHASAESVYSKLSDMSKFGDMLKGAPADALDADKRALLDQVEISGDTISFPAGPAGKVTLRKAEAIEPTLIRLEGVGTPVPMAMSLHITPVLADECRAEVSIDIEVPAMLKPMISGPMKKMVSQIAVMLPQIQY